jgi:thioesterase III
MAYETKIEIRGYHCDAYGHVNNARYLELFEEARWRALDESNVLSLADNQGYLFYIVHLDISFKKPVFDKSNAHIRTSLYESNRRFITFKQSIENEKGELCTEGFVRFVFYDQETKKSVYISEEIKTWFNKFQ